MLRVRLNADEVKTMETFFKAKFRRPEISCPEFT